MRSLAKVVRTVVQWQAKVLAKNPLLGVPILMTTTYLLVFWLPVAVYNLTGLPLIISIPIMAIVNTVHCFSVKRKTKF